MGNPWDIKTKMPKSYTTSARSSPSSRSIVRELAPRVLLLRHRDEWAAWLRAEAEMLDFLGRKFPHVVPPYGFKTSVGTS